MKSSVLFTICAALFLVHQVLQKFMNISVPLIDNYLDPLLFMPILLHLIKLEREFFLKRKYTFSIWQIILWTIAMSIVAEYFFPKWNPKFVSDIIDVILYFVGAIIYYIADDNTFKKYIDEKK